MIKYEHYVFRLPADRPALSRFIAFLAGSLMTTAFAPLGWWVVAPVLVLPLLYVFLTAAPRDAAGHMFWFGLGLFLTGTYWIVISVHVFGHAALWIAILLMVGLAMIMAMLLWLAGWLAAHLSQGGIWRLLLVGPAAWVLIEWVRGWILTGFPWLALGYGQIDSPMAGWAPVLGVYGVSFMLMLSASAAIAALLSSGHLRVIAGLIAAMPWLAGGALTFVEWTEPSGHPVRVSILQAGVSQDKKWEREQLQPIMEFYLAETMSARDSEIIVWPEVAIPALDDQVPRFIDRVEAEARNNGQSVLFGILERSFEQSGEADIYNSLLIVGADERQSYRKRHLVPFGEYFPVPPSVREWMKMQNLPHADLTAGDAVQPPLRTATGLNLAAAICYEDAYSAELLYAFPEANLLINVSNDAWFGDSIAPHQHLEIARMRSLETGRYSVRSTNTGISAFIDDRGKLLAVGDRFVADVLTATVEPRSGTTPFVGSGNRPVIGLCLAVLGLFWIRNRASL